MLIDLRRWIERDAGALLHKMRDIAFNCLNDPAPATIRQRKGLYGTVLGKIEVGVIIQAASTFTISHDEVAAVALRARAHSQQVTHAAAVAITGHQVVCAYRLAAQC